MEERLRDIRTKFSFKGLAEKRSAIHGADLDHGAVCVLSPTVWVGGKDRIRLSVAHVWSCVLLVADARGSNTSTSVP